MTGLSESGNGANTPERMSKLPKPKCTGDIKAESAPK
jgi:hypothetical protein